MFVGFEHREDHNGVGWSKFANSIRHHIKNGPNELGELSHYEGKVSFEVIDTNRNKFQIFTTRSSYADARDMTTLKSEYLSIKSINGQVLTCLNNFGESVSVGIQSSESPLMNEGLTSLNGMISRHAATLSAYGEALPMSYKIINDEVSDVPEWLDFNAKRCCSAGCCNGKRSDELEPPTAVTCQLK